MIDTPYPDSGGRTAERRPRTPRWVKVFGIIGVAVILLVVGVMLFGGGGDHGPGRHAPSSAAGGQAPPSGGHGNTGGIGGPAGADDGARVVEVTTLDVMAFEPGSISVSAGETVTFVVTNGGQAVHEFTLGDAAMQQETRRPDGPDG